MDWTFPAEYAVRDAGDLIRGGTGSHHERKLHFAKALRVITRLPDFDRHVALVRQHLSQTLSCKQQNHAKVRDENAGILFSELEAGRKGSQKINQPESPHG